MKNQELKLGRSFAWFNATQFLGALNDNVFKFLSMFFLIDKFGEKRATVAGALVATIFVIPFLLFTPFAGKLADRFSKRNIVVISKTGEVFVMVLGCLAFWLDSSVMVCIVLFLMCTQSAFFGPSKFGIIPELVRSDQLSRANSFLEALTYLAIVIGSAVAPGLAQVTEEHYVMAGLVCVFIAAFGAWCSWRIEKTSPVGGGRKASLFFIKDVYKPLAEVKNDKYLLMAVFASAYFLLIGGFLQINLIAFGMEALQFSKIQSGYLFCFAAFGIGVGSWLAGRLSGRSVEFGIVPIGAVGLAACSILTGFLDGKQFRYPVFVLTFLTGVSAGMFIVPLQAFIQLRSPKKIRGEVIAAGGFLGWVGVLISAGLLYVLGEFLGLSAAQSFLVLGVLTLGLAIWTLATLPDFFIRFIVVLVARFCYRIKAVDTENVPTEGGVLLVSNHASWVDAIVLSATQQRRIRFVMEREIYNNKWLHPFCRLMKAIPISAGDPPKKIVTSLREARRAMDEGAIVCVFAEGGVTRTGMLREFRGGFEKITRGTSYSIIPVYIGGAWGSIFSYYYGRLLSRFPRKFPYPISIHFGTTMPSESTAVEIRQAVMELSCDYFNSLKPSRKPLGEIFVKTARKHWSRKCMSDATGKTLTYGRALTATVALQSVLAETTTEEKNIGILLPPSCGAALANTALTMGGKVPVNLSYVISEEARQHCIDKARIKTVITSRTFLERVNIDAETPGFVFIEDLIERITPRLKRKAFLRARFALARKIARPRRFQADDVATIVFSSGSTGVPKGVVLSHHNIISNIESARMVFKIYSNDDLCSGLPLFHSFGLAFTLWLPFVAGVSTSYVPNPVDGKLVGETVSNQKSTLLFSTPTFLMTYIRRARTEDFKSLRLVIVGAEKLKGRLAESFEKKFALRPLEGYGVTELSPLISLNVPDVVVGGIKHVGTREGTVGHPIPGLAVRIIDPRQGAPVKPGEPGLLLVKGPNVMLGYLDMAEETAQAIKDGWYNTGDIVTMDEDGFLTITDRLARFSKIGGEMVPHLRIEDAYLKGLHTHEHVIAVTGIPDDKKGEQLAVLYVASECDPDRLHEVICQSDLPNMYKPKRDNYIPVDAIPILGTGKLDITGIHKLALAAKERAKAPGTDD